MEEENPIHDVVDPEVRAYVYSLVTALGGTGADEDGRYVLGDDALACLKDIKRWLKLYDEKANRLDVARCLAEANLVQGDLLEILAVWPEEATEDRVRSKIALASLELLVPLTWPIEKGDMQTTVNHHRHIPYLQLAQISYKREILEHVSSSILRTAIRIGLPSIALPIAERTSRDEGIIKLILYFFRNIALISASRNLPVEWNECEVSRSATIEAFHQQDVLALLLTIASNMGEDFNTQDVVVLEILFHLLKGVDIEKLFMEESQIEAKKVCDLKGLMTKEAAMLREHSKNRPTRHNRFGTMIWVKRDDDRVSTVSGQDVLFNNQHTLAKMDQSKKWNRPKQRGKNGEVTTNSFDMPITLTAAANKKLGSFVEDFLDSGFNPLFGQIRRAIEREAERVLDAHTQQFFYLISWFLEAERIRRRSKRNARRENGKNVMPVPEPESFGIVASVLNQESFISLNRFMQDRLDMKSWVELNAGMRCFTQILLTVQEMAESPLEEDQEIAENIQNRIFYEESTHDRIVAMLRGYKDQGFSYLDACTELSHVFLRMLERYSKENADLQIRTRRRARKKKKDAGQGQGQDQDTAMVEDSEAEDIAEAQRLSRERKFNFTRFSAKFLTQSCVNTFVNFTSFFKDLSQDQLKRAHRYFYRTAFKQNMSVVLFRLDIIALFHRMVKGPDGLNTANPMFGEWEEFSRQLMRRMIKKLEQRPELTVELLFSKINSTVFYLEYGYEKQTIASKPRPPPELEVKGAMTKDEEIGVVVAALVDSRLESVDFVKTMLSSAIIERESWEALANAEQGTALEAQQSIGVEGAENSANASDNSNIPSILIKPDSDERKIAIFKDNKLRLLMALAGFQRIGVDEPDASWIIPSFLTSAMLKETRDIIEKHRNDPKREYSNDDGEPISAEDMLRRKPTANRRAEFDDESDKEGQDSLDEFLFPAGGPTIRRSTDVVAEPKRRSKQRIERGDELDEETQAARRRARELADLEKRRKIKSLEFVNDSDDYSDEERDKEFWANEERIRKGQSLKVREALQTVGAVSDGSESPGSTQGYGGSSARLGKKRKSGGVVRERSKRARNNNTEQESEDEDLVFGSGGSSSPRRNVAVESSDEESETPISLQNEPPLKDGEVENALDMDIENPSQGIGSSKASKSPGSLEGDEDARPVFPSTAKRRGRLTVLEDSDDE